MHELLFDDLPNLLPSDLDLLAVFTYIIAIRSLQFDILVVPLFLIIDLLLLRLLLSLLRLPLFTTLLLFMRIFLMHLLDIMIP